MRYQDDSIDYYGNYTTSEPMSEDEKTILLIIISIPFAIYIFVFLKTLTSGESIRKSHEEAIEAFVLSIVMGATYSAILGIPIAFLYLIYKSIA